MLVHNAEKSIRYTLDYYLNHHKLDTIFIVDWGSFDKTPSILASYQDKNVLTTSIKIQFFDQLPEITSYILKELFLKFDNTWVIPLRTGEFFFSRRYKYLKTLLHHHHRRMVDNRSNTIMLSSSKIFIESERDDKKIDFHPHRMFFCKKTHDKKMILHKINNGFDVVARSLVEDVLPEPEEFVFESFDNDDLECFLYPMPGIQLSTEQILDKSALKIIQTESLWLNNQKANNDVLYEQYSHIKDDTFAEYYRQNWFLTQDHLNEGIEKFDVEYCSDMLSWRQPDMNITQRE